MTLREQIRVLVIDDSAFSRQTITQMLKTSPLVEVVGVARDGEDALRKTLELQPDLVTLDLEALPLFDATRFEGVSDRSSTGTMRGYRSDFW